VRVQWYGQSAFGLDGTSSIFLDPFDLASFAGRPLQFDYPPIDGVLADLLLVTHEHVDHNAVGVVGGDPTILRSTAGRLGSPVGEILAVASEHDAVAGTARGPNTIFAFELDGLRVCHFGDFGQSRLRDEQAEAIGPVDLLFLPVGGGPTIGADQAHPIVERLGPRWVVPMHYRTPRIGFLETADAFLGSHSAVHRLDQPVFETRELPRAEGPLVIVPAVP
jgi:L-ascorbate metabolism protein UlaG (beta-lactamase superfamily)